MARRSEEPCLWLTRRGGIPFPSKVPPAGKSCLSAKNGLAVGARREARRSAAAEPVKPGEPVRRLCGRIAAKRPDFKPEQRHRRNSLK